MFEITKETMISEILENGSVPLKGYRIQPCRHRHRGNSGKEPEGAWYLRHISGRKEEMVREGSGILLQQNTRHRRIPFS